MATILDYKCPHCGGKLEFQPGTEQLQCPYCDSTVDVAALQQLDEVLKNTPEDNMHWQEEAGDEWSVAEQAQMQVYVCKSCGGEIMCDENTAATACPFCGNPVVLGGRVAGTLKPDYVIPFQLDKKAAKEALKTISTRSKASTCRSGCSTRRPTPTCASKRPKRGCGATPSSTTPKPAFSTCTAPALWALPTCRWTAPKRWPTT